MKHLGKDCYFSSWANHANVLSSYVFTSPQILTITNECKAAHARHFHASCHAAPVDSTNFQQSIVITEDFHTRRLQSFAEYSAVVSQATGIDNQWTKQAASCERKRKEEKAVVVCTNHGWRLKVCLLKVAWYLWIYLSIFRRYEKKYSSINKY